MHRITADTNILISAVITQGNEFRLLQLAKEGKLAIGISPHMLKEFAGVIARQKFGFSEEQIADVSEIATRTLYASAWSKRAISEYAQEHAPPSRAGVLDVCKEIISVCTLVMPSKATEVIPEDPADNKVLECAEAFGADYIISGDEHIMRLREYKGMKIVRTAKFLEMVNSKS
ncbi:PIN domain-containing protein [Candidatus Woesearchaeota archaeon]|nr:PIN domain-containing protein [Candidatus Woesearchaeota archaeon]